MSDTNERHLRGLFGRDLVYAGLYVSQAALVTISTPILTRIMPHSQYGTVAVCMTLVQLLVVVSTWRMDLGVQKAFAASGERSSRGIVTIGFAIALALFVLETATGHWWAPALKLGSFHGAIKYTLLWTLLTAATTPALALLRSRDKLGAFAVVAVVQTSLAEALSVVLVVVFRHGAGNYVLGQTIAQAVALVLALYFARPALPRLADLAVIATAIGFATVRLPDLLIGFVNNSSDRLIVNADLGHYELARYAIAGNTAAFVIAILTNISQSWMPRAMSIADLSELREIVLRARDRLLLLTIPLVLALCAGAAILLRIWAPASYRPDGLQPIVAVYAFLAFPIVGDISLWQMTTRLKRALSLPLISAATATINVMLNLALVPVIGLTGSVLATLVATSGEYVLLRRRLPREMRLNRPNSRLIGDVALTCVVGMGICLLPSSLPFLGLRLVVAAGAGFTALSVLASLSGYGKALAGWVDPWISTRVMTAAAD